VEAARVALSRPMPVRAPDYAAAAKVLRRRFGGYVSADFDSEDWLAIATDIVDAAAPGRQP